MLERRREMCEEVLSGKFQVELPDWRARRETERDRVTFDQDFVVLQKYCGIEIEWLAHPN